MYLNNDVHCDRNQHGKLWIFLTAFQIAFQDLCSRPHPCCISILVATNYINIGGSLLTALKKHLDSKRGFFLLHSRSSPLLFWLHLLLGTLRFIIHIFCGLLRHRYVFTLRIIIMALEASVLYSLYSLQDRASLQSAYWSVKCVEPKWCIAG